MAERRGRSNSPSPDRIEPWTWQPNFADLPQPNFFHDADQATPRVTTFDFLTYWRRGGYRGSLNADTDQASRNFLDRLIANDLFVLPARTARGGEIHHGKFLRLLARYNGQPLESLRKKAGWDGNTFRAVIGSLVDRDTIFTLPFEPLIEGRSDLYYFRDTGVLHRLFNPKWTETGSGRRYFAKSWEGLAIQTLMYGPGRGATATVWRQADDEIDLVLRWPDGIPCWAIEIGMGQNKRPSKGFWAGVRQVGATSQYVLHQGVCDRVGGCERLTLERFLETWRASA